MKIFQNEIILQGIELILRLVIAAICGYVIGSERNTRRKEAGIRTHIIVAIASCLMMEISKYGFADIGDFDGARLAAQVVSGIGFLGAGMIFVHKNTVKGLTTAAGIWATSGIGMAIGAGMYMIGIVTTALIMILQVFFHKKTGFLRHLNFETIIFKVTDCPQALDTVKAIIDKSAISFDVIGVKKLESDILKIEVQISFYNGFDMFAFIKSATEEEIVQSVYNA